MKKILLLSVICFGMLLNVAAQGTVVPGTQAPDFSLPDAVSGKTVSLADFKGKKAVVLIFTSNYCPYSRLYEARINQLVSQYKDKGVAFVLINPNDPLQNAEESEAAMKEKANSWGNGLPYLSDKKQQISQRYGASKTPEVFVLTPRSDSFTVFYTGALDDNPQVAGDVSQFYLQQALDGALTGKTLVVKSKRPVGCMIKAIE